MSEAGQQSRLRQKKKKKKKARSSAFLKGFLEISSAAY
jgi:hypothetical protein